MILGNAKYSGILDFELMVKKFKDEIIRDLNCEYSVILFYDND